MTALSRRGLGLLALSGCVDPAPSTSVRMAPGVVLVLPEPAELGRDVEAAQLVQARYGVQDFAFEAQISVTSARLLLACVDPLGRVALTLRWGQGRLDVQAAAWLPGAIRPDNMLADIMVLFWPEPSIRRALATSGATLASGAGWRAVRAGAEEVIRAEIPQTPWNGTLRYRNLVWGYTLDVQSVEVTP